MSPSPIELVRPRWAHLEYSWQLDNFWELRALACVEALDDENGSLIWSQTFGDNEKGRWQMKLYPYGDLSSSGRGHVSLFLAMDLKALTKAYAVFGCYLLDEEGNKISNSGRSFTRQKFFEGSSSWGWSQFIKNEGQSLNRFLTCNDSLIIKCEIEVFTGILTSPPASIPAPESWEQEVRSYLCDPRHYNVTILTSDGHELRARREILQARSKWFDREFRKSVNQTLSLSMASPIDKPPFADQITSDVDENGAAKSRPDNSSTSLTSSLQESKKKGASFLNPPLTSSNTDQLQPANSTTNSAIISPSASTDLGYTSFGLDESAVILPPTPPASTQNTQQPIELKPAARPTPKTTSSTAANSHESSPLVQHDYISLENFSAEITQNIIQFTHTDECEFHGPNARLQDLLDLLSAAKLLEIPALYKATTRRVCASLITKANAIAIQHVAKKLEDRSLEDHCTMYLTMCVRDLSKDEIIKTLTSRKAS